MKNKNIVKTNFELKKKQKEKEIFEFETKYKKQIIDVLVSHSNNEMLSNKVLEDRFNKIKTQNKESRSIMKSFQSRNIKLPKINEHKSSNLPKLNLNRKNCVETGL